MLHAALLPTAQEHDEVDGQRPVYGRLRLAHVVSCSMIFPSRAFVLLCLLVAVDSAAADKFTDAGLVPVTSLDQLWRYQVGPCRGPSVTPGDDYICLSDWKGHFVRGTPEGPYNDGRACDCQERFAVNILGDNLVSIKRWKGNYLSCNKPDAGASSSLVQTAKFILYINEDEDNLYLYNPYYHRVLGGYESNGLLKCSFPDPEASAKFYGWKEGPRDAWRATDKWVRIGTFDNRKSNSTGTFKYFKTIGMKKTRWSALGARVYGFVAVGPLFGKFFSRIVKTTIDVDWSEAFPAVWSKQMTTEDSVNVPPGGVTAIYQAFGTYGIYTIMSNYVRWEDLDSEGNVLHYQRPLAAAT